MMGYGGLQTRSGWEIDFGQKSLARIWCVLLCGASQAATGAVTVWNNADFINTQPVHQRLQVDAIPFLGLVQTPVYNSTSSGMQVTSTGTNSFRIETNVGQRGIHFRGISGVTGWDDPSDYYSVTVNGQEFRTTYEHQGIGVDASIVDSARNNGTWDTSPKGLFYDGTENTFDVAVTYSGVQPPDIATRFSFDVIERIAPPKQKIVLAFGSDVPYIFENSQGSLLTDLLTLQNRPGPMTFKREFVAPEFVSESSQAEILSEVKQYFADAGVENIEVEIGAPKTGAKNVYFSSQTFASLAGYAFEQTNEAIIFDEFASDITPGIEDTLHTTLHEIGHLFGLDHVCASCTHSATGKLSVMRQGGTKPKGFGLGGIVGLTDGGSEDEGFINEQLKIDGTDREQNAQYILNRIIDNDSPEKLIYDGIVPAEVFDETRVQAKLNRIDLGLELDNAQSLDPSNASFSEFEVYVEKEGVLVRRPTVVESLEDVKNLRIDVDDEGEIFIVGKNSDGRPFVLTREGDAGLEAGGVVSDESLSFSFIDDNTGAFEPFIDLSITAVPEPVSSSLVIFGLAMLISQRVRL